MNIFKHKYIYSLALLTALTGSLLALPQNESATQDVKDAGSATKHAAKHVGSATKKTAKKTGHAVKKTTKKVVHASAKKTKHAAEKVQDKTN
jgi:hypothetical protein